MQGDKSNACWSKELGVARAALSSCCSSAPWAGSGWPQRTGLVTSSSWPKVCQEGLGWVGPEERGQPGGWLAKPSLSLLATHEVRRACSSSSATVVRWARSPSPSCPAGAGAGGGQPVGAGVAGECRSQFSILWYWSHAARYSHSGH